jgi:tRNA U34 2-thiouridine synthase MnmA/TrmU
MRIAGLISGGVDSSVVVHLLKEAGYTPTLFYIKIGMDDDDLLHCDSEEDIEMATLVAHQYGCDLEIIDLHRDYWDTVVAYTIDKVKKGFTPNPDVMCNKLIKFGVFEEKAGRYFDKTATGHYATTIEKNGKTYLGTAKDILKDQTDFLAQINHLQVSKLMFPIGSLMKEEVRRIATQAHLPSAPFFVVISITPFAPREPYMAVADASFRTSIELMSFGFIRFNGLFDCLLACS